MINKMSTSNGDGVQIPVIDISNASQETGDAMVDAAARYGFFYVRADGTGFTPGVVDDMFELVFCQS